MARKSKSNNVDEEKPTTSRKPLRRRREATSEPQPVVPGEGNDEEIPHSIMARKSKSNNVDEEKPTTSRKPLRRRREATSEPQPVVPGEGNDEEIPHSIMARKSKSNNVDEEKPTTIRKSLRRRREATSEPQPVVPGEGNDEEIPHSIMARKSKSNNVDEEKPTTSRKPLRRRREATSEPQPVVPGEGNDEEIPHSIMAKKIKRNNVGSEKPTTTRKPSLRRRKATLEPEPDVPGKREEIPLPPQQAEAGTSNSSGGSSEGGIQTPRIAAESSSSPAEQTAPPRPERRYRPTANRVDLSYSSMSRRVNGQQSDHSKWVLEKLATFHNMELMNDIILVVGGTEYPTHRLMLSKSSEVFQAMFMNIQSSESHRSRVVLEETQACLEIFGDFIEFFYTGKIKTNLETICTFFLLADKYKVKDLIYLCTEYMCNHLALAATNNQLVIWYQFTLSLGHHVAALACQYFLKCNFEMVAKSKDFGNCNRKIVSRLLQWNDLVVTNEITLFHLIEGWLEYQQQTRLEEGVDMMEPLVYEVMSHVRFPMMTPRQLVDLLVSPLVMKYKGFFIERMAASMSFHRNKKEIMQQVLQDKNGALMFTPRLYTAKSTCCTLTIDKFTQFPCYQTRSFICSSPSGWAEHLGDKHCDWVVNVSPREVRFFKSSLNAPSYLIPLPEKTLKTVRVSITSKNDTTEFVKVKIGVLVVGVEDGVEHIIRVVHKIYHFNKDDHLLNIDNVIPFQELTCSRRRRGIRYQVGPDFDTLKLHVVIVPLTEESSTAPQPNLLWSMR